MLTHSLRELERCTLKYWYIAQPKRAIGNELVVEDRDNAGNFCARTRAKPKEFETV